MKNKIIFGNSQNMKELNDKSIHLVVTSPPYYNAPFDYPDMFSSFEEYLQIMRNVIKEIMRVLDDGRIVAYVVDDTLINAEKFPVVSEITRLFIEEGFRYRDRITWIKPEGYIRISRRSGVLLQNPYPMYFYPDNLQESILLFQKGKFDYKKIPKSVKEESRIDKKIYQRDKWFLSTWNITNVLPRKDRLENGIAAFPNEIPKRLIKLFAYKGETILDPFMGSGTTLKVATELNRKCVGYELDIELLDVVKKKLEINEPNFLKNGIEYSIIIREDIMHLRTKLQEKIQNNNSCK